MTLNGFGLSGRTLVLAASATTVWQTASSLGKGASVENWGTFTDQNPTVGTGRGVAIAWDGIGGMPTFNNHGSYVKTGAGTTNLALTFNNSGSVEVRAGVLSFTNFTQTSGSTILNGGSLVGTLPIQGGTLTGAGTISGSVTNGGQVSPGSAMGIISLQGNYNQSSSGALKMEIGGTTVGTQYDQLNVMGTVSLGGSLNVSLVNGFVPSTGNSFRIIDNDATDPVSGTFGGLPEGTIFSVGGRSFQISYVGGTGNDVVLTAINVPPSVGLITGPVSPLPVNSTVNVSAGFSDLNVADTHTAVWSWGDNATSAGSVTESNGSGSVTGSHLYTAAGVYTVTLTVTDNGGSSGQSVFQYVVVYDPSAGFVTGGGWINSPSGAYVPDPSLAGKANFGFESKYQPGANVPTGNTQFLFHEASFNFRSTSYDWLVVGGPRAQFKGSGTVNGNGSYSFLLTAIDGQVNGGGGVDKFRLKVWNAGGIIYDNQMNAPDSADPTTALGGGSITIRTNGGGGGGQAPAEPGNNTGDGDPNPDLVDALLAETAQSQQAPVLAWRRTASPQSYVDPVRTEVSVRLPGAPPMPGTGAVPSGSVLRTPGPDRKAERIQLLDGLFAEGETDRFSLAERTRMLPLP